MPRVSAQEYVNAGAGTGEELWLLKRAPGAEVVISLKVNFLGDENEARWRFSVCPDLVAELWREEREGVNVLDEVMLTSLGLMKRLELRKTDGKISEIVERTSLLSSI